MTSTLSNDGDESLFGDVLDRAAGGDEGAINALLAEFEPGLIKFTRSRGVKDPEAVVNSALSDAFTSLGRFRGRDRRAFRAYLYQILRRRITDQYRRSYTQPKTVSGLDDDLVSGLVDHDASDFDERLADRELVEEILDQLTEEQREVLEMRVLTGLSIKETATMTGRSEGAVKSMQRRALSSLRAVVIAVAVIALGALAVRAMINAGEGIVVVENAPADGSAPAEDSPTADGEESQRAVLEAEVPEATTPTTAAPGDDVATDGPTTPDELASVDDQATAEDGPDTNGAQPPGAGDESGAPIPTSAPESAATPDPATTPSTTPTAVVDPIPSAPCSVITDGSPARGEVAFVVFHFTGPYELFKGASAEVIGPANKSALIPGKASPDRVWDGTRLPFVIGGNMLGDDGLAVRTYLGGREVKADCEVSDQVMRPPCTVKVEDDPARGDTASVAYRTPSPYWTLEGQATYIIGKDNESAMKSGDDATFKAKVTRNFVIDGSMFRDGELLVRTAFADGAGHAVCKIG